MTTVGRFEAFYGSAWHHPGLLWLSGALGLLLTLRAGAPPPLQRWALGWIGISFLDAWLSADHVLGVGRLRGAAAGLLPFLLVLAGDLRVFWTTTSLTRDAAGAPGPGEAPAPRLLPVALGLSLIAPFLSWVLTGPLRAIWPARWDPVRTLFVAYELSFLAVVLTLRRRAYAAHPAARRVAAFSLLYYGLWVAADLVILHAGGTARDLGFLLRVVPNVLYYGFCVPVLLSALRDAGGRRTRAA